MSILDDESELIDSIDVLPEAQKYFGEHYTYRSNDISSSIEESIAKAGKWYRDEQGKIHLTPVYSLIFKATSCKDTLTNGLFIIDDAPIVFEIDANGRTLKTFNDLPKKLGVISISHHKGNIKWDTFPDNCITDRLFLTTCSITTLKGCQLQSDEIVIKTCRKLESLEGLPQNLKWCMLSRCAVTDLQGITMQQNGSLHLEHLTKLTSLNGLQATQLDYLTIKSCTGIRDWSAFPKYINSVIIIPSYEYIR